MPDATFSVSFQKSRHADYNESVALARRLANTFKEKHTKDGVVNTATFTYTNDDVKRALELMQKIARYPTATFSVGRKKTPVDQALSGLLCYYEAGCPTVWSEKSCLSEKDELGLCFFCKNLVIDTQYGHPWWTLGSFDQAENGNLVWNFSTKRIKSAINSESEELQSCPIFPTAAIEQRLKDLEKPIYITTETGFLQFYETLGIDFDLSDYIDSKASSYTAHDEDLVKITHHSPTCALCRHWHGKIYSISGRSGKYPPLKLAIQGGLFHPGCIHSETLYLDDTDTKPNYQHITQCTTNKRHTQAQFGGGRCALYSIFITAILYILICFI